MIDGAGTPAPLPGGFGKAGAALRWAGLALALPAVWIAGKTALAERAFGSGMSVSDPAARLPRLESSLGFDSRYWRAHEAKASLFLETGRPVEAGAAATEALKIRPNGAVAFNYAAIAKLRTGALAEGESLLRQALERAPHCWLTHLHLGALEYERGAFARAEGHYGKAEFVAWNMPQIPYRRAETHLVRNNLPVALPLLRRAQGLGYPVGAALRRDHPGMTADPLLAEFFP
jgi:tetratricopeptide (TPR) repeat protein